MSCQSRTGEGQVRSGQVRLVQIRIRHDIVTIMSGQDSSDQVSSGHVMTKSCQIRSGQIMSGPYRSKSGQIRTCHGKVMSD